MKNSWPTKVLPSLMLVSFLLLASPTFAAPDLTKSVESIADDHYFRKELIELLYDKHVDYEKAFSCTKLNELTSGSRIDALCNNKSDVFVLTIVLADNSYAGYVTVCAAGITGLDPYNLAESAYKSDSTNFEIEKRNTYHMGRTNGWIKDFENLFLTVEMPGLTNSCWALNKR